MNTMIRKLVSSGVAVAAVLGLGACDRSPSDPDRVVLGTTAGWFNGQVVQFDYTQDFFCRQPPASNAPSGCAVGAEPQTTPEPGELPVVYVMTPLFSPAPPASHLHCPTAGSCVAHPTTLDVGRVLGPDAANIPLPPHSHIVETTAEGRPVWWEIEVIGVTERAVWDQVVAARSLPAVRQLQAAGQGITPDLPSNLFLRFAVR